MKSEILLATTLASAFLLAGCGARGATNPADGAPQPAEVEEEGNANLVKVAHPEQFPLVTAARYDVAPVLNVTGTVSADVSRNVPVISVASGRVLEVHARLGDTVTKGQLLLRVQSADISGAFSDYRQALADETLARAQLERSKLLYERGAIAQKDLEVAQDVEDKAKVTVETTAEHLRVLGADKDHVTAIVDIVAPVSGVITDQQVTTAAGTQGLASPNAFTISDLSRVWVVCDVYENDLAFVHLDEFAEIRLNAFPNTVLRGRISNIGPDPGPESAHREGSAGGRESGLHASGNVRESHVPRAGERGGRDGSVYRDSAPPRPRLDVSAHGQRAIPARGSSRRGHAARQYAGGSNGSSAGAARGPKRPGSAEHRGAITDNDPRPGRLRTE